VDQTEQPLDEEDFDMSATRPPLTFGLPHTLTCTLLAAGMFGLALYDTVNLANDLVYDGILLGGIGIFWSTAKIMLRSDYHGWDIFIAWLKLDFFCLDTKDWGGTHLSSFPLQSIYRCGAHDPDA